MKKKIIFRDYNQKQMVLPSSIITLIPENHVVRVVNDIIDSIEATLRFFPEIVSLRNSR